MTHMYHVSEGYNWDGANASEFFRHEVQAQERLVAAIVISPGGWEHHSYTYPTYMQQPEKL